MSAFSVAAVFSSKMVLQRDKNIMVFGKGEEGSTIEVRLQGPGGKRSAKTSVRKGRFCAELTPLSAGEGYEMTVTDGKETKTFTDIAIGEVWVAGGQSNMELELRNCEEGPAAMENDKNVNVRFYYTQKRGWKNEEFYKAEANTAWEKFGDPGTGAWSAVGYFFARKLSRELKCVVGVIGCNWGGTSASAWMDMDSLEYNAELKSYVDDYREAIKGKSEEQQIAEYLEYEQYHANWEAKAAEYTKEHPEVTWDELQEICGPNKWPGPMSCINPYRPAGLYECMLKRITPYTVRGVIWYQGESDDHKPRIYEPLFGNMIRVWRREWNDPRMPFLFVQLPMNRYMTDPDYRHWSYIREAQTNVFLTVKNVGMAMISDYSTFNDIHPKKKQVCGERLEAQAMYHVYHKIDAQDAMGPMYRTFRVCEEAEEIPEVYHVKHPGIELVFDYAQEGFSVKKREEVATYDERFVDERFAEIKGPKGFEIASEDKEYVPAECVIRKNKIYVYSEKVTKPRYVRYAWSNYLVPEIYGEWSGIPLGTFRTDFRDEKDTDEEMGKTTIQQIMEV